MSKAKTPGTGAPALDASEAALLAGAIAPVAIEPERLARMRRKVLAGASESVASSTRVLRAAEGDWKTLLPGITIKTLHVDREQNTETSLWRLAPGARVPRHPHSKDEECLILEGSITYDGQTYEEGDYLHTRAGLRHSEFVAPQGALLLIRSERIPPALLIKLASLLPG